MNDRPPSPSNFIRHIIDSDLASGKHHTIITRFPPEPNGYLHVGHAKSICLNFGLAEDYRGRCHLRFDDTDPGKESVEYTEAIKRDVRWLGFDWGDNLFNASDYFERLYEYAEALIKKSKAYVCELSAEQIRDYRGTLTEPGRESPFRNRLPNEIWTYSVACVAVNFADGTRVLRAKIDMASPNINMRDPTIYRIRRIRHHLTGDRWCIYPMYDFTHCISDALEGITHSICTLEFEDHRPLYDWFLEELETPCHPQQVEFARLNINYTVTSKRKLNELVTLKLVSGWDDPRMPTIGGMRRRGFTPASIRDFCERIGVTKKESVIDMVLLENCVREDLDRTTARAMAVLRPLKLVIENYPEGKTEDVAAANHPNDATMGVRMLPFSRELFIEREDFMENPPKGYFRLFPGAEVRLRYAYFVKCERVIKDPATNQVVELRCSYDPATRGGSAPDGRKVKGTIHWVSAAHARSAEVRLYDRLFSVPNPAASKDVDYKTFVNPDSITVLKSCRVEAALADSSPESRYQFERLGYFCSDIQDHSPGAAVFNRIVSLRDSWVKERAGSMPR